MSWSLETTDFPRGRGEAESVPLHIYKHISCLFYPVGLLGYVYSVAWVLIFSGTTLSSDLLEIYSADDDSATKRRDWWGSGGEEETAHFLFMLSFHTIGRNIYPQIRPVF